MKFHEDQSFRCGDIGKTILEFFYRWFSMYFSYFLNYTPPKPSEMDNYWMVMTFFGNHTSKCNRLSKNMRPIQPIEVLYRLRNKQKHYLIYSETPCIYNTIKKSIFPLFRGSWGQIKFLIENKLGQRQSQTPFSSTLWFRDKNFLDPRFFCTKNLFVPKYSWEWSLTLALAQLVFVDDIADQFDIYVNHITQN